MILFLKKVFLLKPVNKAQHFYYTGLATTCTEMKPETKSRRQLKRGNLSTLFTLPAYNSQTVPAHLAPCARCTTFGNTAMTRTTSSIVESRPSEKRTREFASLRSTPKAEITCDGSREPEPHAEPLLAQMPSRSKPAISAILSAPATRKETVLTSRCSREPTNWRPGRDSTAAINRAESGVSCDFEKTGVGMKRSMASTMPAMAARFSVPARRSFSCAPPKMMESGWRGERM